MIAKELTPEARDDALRAARLAAMKAAKGKHREAFEKARARRRLAERAAFFEDDDTEAQEMADTMEFDDQGGDE